MFQQEAQAEQKIAHLEFSSFRGLILPANQLSRNDRNTAPASTIQSCAAAGSCSVILCASRFPAFWSVCTCWLLFYLADEDCSLVRGWCAHVAALYLYYPYFVPFGRSCPFVIYAVLYLQSHGQINSLWVPLIILCHDMLKQNLIMLNSASA